MKWLSHLLLLCTCLGLAPAAVQKEPDKQEQARAELEARAKAWLESHAAFLAEVEEAFSSEDLGTEGSKVVIQINTRLTTLRASPAPSPPEEADTRNHEVNHLTNDDGKLLDATLEEASWAIGWRCLLDAQSVTAGQFAASTPIKAEAVTEQLRWADQQLRGIAGRLSGSPTSVDVQRELDGLSRVRTTLRNTSRALTTLIDRGTKWLEEIEESGASLSEGLERIKRFQAEVIEGKAASKCNAELLEMLRGSIPIWIRTAEAALEANQAARKAAKEQFDPFDQETLLKGIPSFKDATFETLADVVEPHEKALKKLKRR